MTKFNSDISGWDMHFDALKRSTAGRIFRAIVQVLFFASAFFYNDIGRSSAVRCNVLCKQCVYIFICATTGIIPIKSSRYDENGAGGIFEYRLTVVSQPDFIYVRTD